MFSSDFDPNEGTSDDWAPDDRESHGFDQSSLPVGGTLAVAKQRRVKRRTRAVSKLPVDKRARQGGWLFLVALGIFFLAGMILYGLYAYTRWETIERQTPLPGSLLISTALLLVISLMTHLATRSVRRDRFAETSVLLLSSVLLAILFTVLQCQAIYEMLMAMSDGSGTGVGIFGMVISLVVLHALHVLGGVIALGIVGALNTLGRYDHERHWPIDFSASYWHFLDLIWLIMLGIFWATSGGFAI